VHRAAAQFEAARDVTRFDGVDIWQLDRGWQWIFQKDNRVLLRYYPADKQAMPCLSSPAGRANHLVHCRSPVRAVRILQIILGGQPTRRISDEQTTF
jgi:hypothetical protein